MRIYTGEVARKMIRRIAAGGDVPEGIYDYEIDRGFVFIDKDSGDCAYMKHSKGSKTATAIAIQGTQEEFRNLIKTLDAWDIKEMLKFAKEEVAQA